MTAEVWRLLARITDLEAAVERARDLFITVEGQNAEALSVHVKVPVTHPATVPPLGPICGHCLRPWPCPTARALGVES